MSPLPRRQDTDDRLEALEQFVSRRPSVNRDRTQGQSPLSIESVGDLRFFRWASGSVSNNGTASIYLTFNGEVGGGAVFSTMPLVMVGRDVAATPGGLPRAAAPLSPSTNLQVACHTNWTLKWDGANQRHVVTVTNDSGGATGFVVVAGGL